MKLISRCYSITFNEEQRLLVTCNPPRRPANCALHVTLQVACRPGSAPFAVSLVWAGITHGWFVQCAVCWCQMINGKKTASIETQTSKGASGHEQILSLG